MNDDLKSKITGVAKSQMKKSGFINSSFVTDDKIADSDKQHSEDMATLGSGSGIKSGPRGDLIVGNKNVTEGERKKKVNEARARIQTTGVNTDPIHRAATAYLVADKLDAEANHPNDNTHDHKTREKAQEAAKKFNGRERALEIYRRMGQEGHDQILFDAGVNNGAIAGRDMAKESKKLRAETDKALADRKQIIADSHDIDVNSPEMKKLLFTQDVSLKTDSEKPKKDNVLGILEHLKTPGPLSDRIRQAILAAKYWDRVHTIYNEDGSIFGVISPPSPSVKISEIPDGIDPEIYRLKDSSGINQLKNGTNISGIPVKIPEGRPIPGIEEFTKPEQPEHDTGKITRSAIPSFESMMNFRKENQHAPIIESMKIKKSSTHTPRTPVTSYDRARFIVNKEIAASKIDKILRQIKKNSDEDRQYGGIGYGNSSTPENTSEVFGVDYMEDDGGESSAEESKPKAKEGPREGFVYEGMIFGDSSADQFYKEIVENKLNKEKDQGAFERDVSANKNAMRHVMGGTDVPKVMGANKPTKESLAQKEEELKKEYPAFFRDGLDDIDRFMDSEAGQDLLKHNMYILNNDKSYTLNGRKVVQREDVKKELIKALKKDLELKEYFDQWLNLNNTQTTVDEVAPQSVETQPETVVNDIKLPEGLTADETAQALRESGVEPDLAEEENDPEQVADEAAAAEAQAEAEAEAAAAESTAQPVEKVKGMNPVDQRLADLFD